MQVMESHGMCNQGWHNTVGNTTHFHQCCFDIPSVMQHLGEYVEMLKRENQKLENALITNEGESKVEADQNPKSEVVTEEDGLEVGWKTKVEKKTQQQNLNQNTETVKVSSGEAEVPDTVKVKDLENSERRAL